MFEFVILIVILIFLLHKWSTAKHSVLKNRNIPHLRPKRFIGNTTWTELFGKEPLIRNAVKRHKQFEGSKFYGVYSFHHPVIILRDVDLIKRVCIKEFDVFSNHHSGKSESEDDLLNKSLIKLKDHKWKMMRNILTPTFTANKMRVMYELINECSIKTSEYLQVELNKCENNELNLEMKEFFTRFTNDVIASTAFGLKVDSFNDRQNKFYQIGTTVTNVKGLRLLKIMLFAFMSNVMKKLRVSIIDEASTNYFRHLVFDAIKYRQTHNIVRPDMIQLLMEAKANSNEMTDEDLLAQCFIFFLAGFETVSTCLCFTTYELAMNPDVQDKLYSEICEVEEELNGKPLTYDILMNMKYLDMVILESLRKWPPSILTDRVCSTDFDLRDEENNLILQLKKNDLIVIPILALHYDDEHFTQPELFEPERFEHKATNKMKAYMPFGMGPRACIANRFGLMEVKSLIYYMVKTFQLLPSEQTVVNMIDSIKGFRMQPKELFWLKFIKRNTSPFMPSE